MSQSSSRSQLPASPLAGEAPVHVLFERRADLRGPAAAVRCGDDTLSYGELERRANVAASVLADAGVCPGTRVGLCVPRGVPMVAAVLGILKAGGAYVPLDRRFPPQRLAFISADAGLSLVVGTGEIPDLGVPVVPLDEGPVAEEWAGEDGRRGARAPVPVTGEDLAYVLYTSGSTGQPKGVMVQHTSVAALYSALSEIVDMGPSAVAVLNAGLNFDASIQQLLVLCGGGQLIIPTDEQRDSPHRFVALLDEVGATSLDCTPSHLPPLIEAGLAGSATLRHLLVGGEPISAPLRQVLASAPFTALNAYGTTECTVDSVIGEITSEAAQVIGRPLRGTQAVVVDSHGDVVPVGVTGELLVGGAGVARGYAGQPGMTADRFVPDGFFGGEGRRLYRTGDLVRWRADGLLEFVGRADDQVKIRGFRVEPAEVESVVAGFAGVGGTAVVAREDPGGQRRLVAYVTAAPGAAGGPPMSRLREWVAERLPDYLVPSEFVLLDELPMTANGKADRRALPEPAAVRPQPAQGFVAASSPGEQALARIWCEVLRQDRIGVYDNFFDLGGDSITSLLIVAKAAREQLRLTTADIFEHQTIHAILRAAASPDPSLPPRERDGDRALNEGPAIEVHPGAAMSEERLRGLLAEAPDIIAVAPSAAVQGGQVFQSASFPGTELFVQQFRYSVAAGTDLGCLRAAWQDATDAFSVLRTSFAWDDHGRPVQVIRSRAPIPFDVNDWSHLRPDRADKARSSFLAADRQRGFDEEKAPLQRITALLMPGWETEVVWTYHHALLDGWSYPLVLRRIAGAYRRIVEYRPPAPPETNGFVTITDWIERQDVDAATELWRRYLDGFDGTRQLAGIGGDGTHWASRWRWLDTDLVTALENVARRYRVTASMIYCTGWGMVLCERAGCAESLFGQTVSGRPPEITGVESIVGQATNSVPVRVRMPSAAGGPVESLLWAWNEYVAVRGVEWLPMSRIRELLGTPGGQPPYSTDINCEYLPALDTVDELLAPAGLRTIAAASRNSVPVSLGIIRRSGRLQCHLRLRDGTVQEADEVLGQFLGVLRRLADEAGAQRRCEAGAGSGVAAHAARSE
ncbi:MAG TPA: amino acid adenylation domain-containing protein [Streptosporangiaceae bacterium]|nr:amino acid adenylation domain-containing protein [Streptosporangiaceae bacterium]